jgi:uroporphyrinogen-III synthase
MYMTSKKIVVTRAAHQAIELEKMLERRGAVPVPYPCIEIEPEMNSPEFDNGIHGVSRGEFDWIVFTSANAVFAVARRCEMLGVDLASIGEARIAAIGPGTRDAIAAVFGLDVELVPGEYEAEPLAAALAPRPGTRIFLPQSDIARPVLRATLDAGGADVAAVTAYKTVMGRGGADVPRLLEAGEIDAVTFTSSSTVDNFSRRLTEEGSGIDMVGTTCVACLGRKTTGSALALGLTVHVTPPENTLESLVSSLDEYFKKT